MDNLLGWAILGLLLVHSVLLWRISRKPPVEEKPLHEYAERPATPPPEKEDNGGVTLMTPDRDEKILADEDWQ